jgi:oleate hydratase
MMPAQTQDAGRAAAPPGGAAQTYCVGGGIAALAAAAFLIRDGGVPGKTITIIEDLAMIGGSLDGAGSPQGGYSARGGRMLESKYLCNFDLFSAIPTLDGSQTVTAEIFKWSETIQTSSKSRLMRAGKRQIAPKFGLSEWQILAIEWLVIEPEMLLGSTAIADHFDAAFFKTDFWFMWCTTFAFQPWHSAVEFKRYLVRFAHMVSGFERLEGIMRTVYNQYDSLVLPLHHWLATHGVTFELNMRVTDLDSADESGLRLVQTIRYERDGAEGAIAVHPQDRVVVTLGSMTEASSLGTMIAAPLLNWRTDGPSWALWRKIAAGRPELGRPFVFANHVDQSKWVSFTTTLHDPALLQVIEAATGNAPGEGGLVTFPDSNWLLSIVIPCQPHFIGQPADVTVLWGYGLSVDQPGNFVHKPMADCSGHEIMTELLGHLHIIADPARILETCICIPCMMPFITSQFLPRAPGDRPPVLPDGWGNLALIGQFCEIPQDVVFTVEYSIRSAQIAAYGLLGLDRAPPPVYQGKLDLNVIKQAFMALHDLRPVPVPGPG